MKRSHTPSVSRITSLFLAAVLLVTACQACLGNDDNPADLAGLQGGLIVQLGANDMQAAAELSRTGRYLMHVLDTNAKVVQSTQ
ncbi:MAG: hypothetical protein VYA84_03205 [Planctomycetota bacterium]|nr:hypothetical protein [Planctomycetota bacterium]